MRPITVLPVVLFAHAAVAQSPSSTARQPAPVGATVSGIVRDSISHTALAGAIVQLVADTTAHVAHTVFADSLGRYSVEDLPDGRYAIGFSHPVLDSIGVQPPLRHVTLSGRRPARVDLVTPSPAELRAAICGPRASTDSTGVIVGTVHEARDGSPMPGVSVVVQWSELSFTTTGIKRANPSLVASTGENGWFALCSIPADAPVMLTANRGADSTDMIEVRLGADGFLRRELFLGTAHTIVQSPAASTSPDSLALPPRRVRTGTGSLAGVVVTMAGQPLPAARVSLADGPQVRTNERGEFIIANAPAGTRMLEVRALGYYPERRAVDIVAGAPSVHVTLATLRSVLDTVKVTANRVYNRDREGFEQRRRLGHGRYMTGEEIARRNPLNTTDLFRTVTGMHINRSATDTTGLLVRGRAAGWCSPAVYVDGMFMRGMSADELDDFVPARKVTGIEVYVGTTMPVQFQRQLTGCGSIVLWTR